MTETDRTRCSDPGHPSRCSGIPSAVIADRHVSGAAV